MSRYKEYKLGSLSSSVFGASKTYHHVMVMPNKEFSFVDRAMPISLYRQPQSNEMNIDMVTDESVNITGVNAPKKKATLILDPEDEQIYRKRIESKDCWILEDGDGFSWAGKRGTAPSKYVLFVNQGNEIRVLPVAKWYHFSPRIQYPTINIDEAEQRMQSGTIKESSNIGSDNLPIIPKDEEESNSKSTRLQDILRITDPQASKFDRPRYRVYSPSDEKVSVDYEEIFDDDEEIEDIIEPSSDRIHRNMHPLSHTGKQLRKTLRHLDKDNFYESDGESDPYASEEESITSSPSTPSTVLQQTVSERQLKRTVSFIQPVQDQRIQDEKSSGMPLKRIKILLPSSSDKRHEDDSMILTEDDIIMHLSKGPLKTKELISLMRNKLKASPENKERFRVLVKKLATVKVPSTGNEDDRYLELKEGIDH